jgi:hypothetical protein
VVSSSNWYFWWPDEVQIHSQGLCGITKGLAACVHFTHIVINCSKRSEVLGALLLKFDLLGCYAVLVGKELTLLGRTCQDLSHSVKCTCQIERVFALEQLLLSIVNHYIEY